MAADTVVVTAGTRVLKVPITYDAEIASELIGDVSIVQDSHNAGFISSVKGSQLSFNESGLLTVSLYTIDGAMIQKVCTDKSVASGEVFSVDGAMKSLASGYYILKGSFNQKEFSLKIQK